VTPLADALLENLVRRQRSKSALPASLLHAVIERESRGIPAAVGDAGRARGLMQVHPAAAAEAGYQHGEMHDPAKGVDAGASYLDDQMVRFKGDPALALSAYNAGPGRTRRAGGVAPSAAEYVQSILTRAAELANTKFPSDAEVLPDSASETMTLDQILDQDRIARITKQISAAVGRK